MSQKPELIVSGDGSHSIVSPLFNTTYHSKNGAITESQVVFIDAALNYLLAANYKSIDVFEMGFGTGLNAILAQQWAEEHQIALTYNTVEAFPVDLEIVHSLNYGSILNCRDAFLLLHEIDWNKSHNISPYFNFCKWNQTIESLELNQKFDAIFYDAFAPSEQPELWQIKILAKMFDRLNHGGVLTSFCAQGAFKRNLKEVGFRIESIPGPPGKREMTRAIKPD